MSDKICCKDFLLDEWEETLNKLYCDLDEPNFIDNNTQEIESNISWINTPKAINDLSKFIKNNQEEPQKANQDDEKRLFFDSLVSSFEEAQEKYMISLNRYQNICINIKLLQNKTQINEILEKYYINAYKNINNFDFRNSQAEKFKLEINIADIDTLLLKHPDNPFCLLEKENIELKMYFLDKIINYEKQSKNTLSQLDRLLDLKSNYKKDLDINVFDFEHAKYNLYNFREKNSKLSKIFCDYDSIVLLKNKTDLLEQEKKINKISVELQNLFNEYQDFLTENNILQQQLKNIHQEYLDTINKLKIANDELNNFQNLSFAMNNAHHPINREIISSINKEITNKKMNINQLLKKLDETKTEYNLAKTDLEIEEISFDYLNKTMINKQTEYNTLCTLYNFICEEYKNTTLNSTSFLEIGNEFLPKNYSFEIFSFQTNCVEYKECTNKPDIISINEKLKKETSDLFMNTIIYEHML